jgi:hypothetical protein
MHLLKLNLKALLVMAAACGVAFFYPPSRELLSWAVGIYQVIMICAVFLGYAIYSLTTGYSNLPYKVRADLFITRLEMVRAAVTAYPTKSVVALDVAMDITSVLMLSYFLHPIVGLLCLVKHLLAWLLHSHILNDFKKRTTV